MSRARQLLIPTWPSSPYYVYVTPSQSLGSELVTNGDFADWTGDDPDNFSVFNESLPNREITERDSGDLHADAAGTGSANFYSDSATDVAITQGAVFTANSWHEVELVVSAINQPSVTAAGDLTALFAIQAGAVATYRTMYHPRVDQTQLIIGRTGSTSQDITLDSISVKPVTGNVEQTTQANADNRFFFDLLESPEPGRYIVNLVYRKQDDTHFWLAHLEYDGSQWNAYLVSWDGNSQTVRITASNVGTPNGIRVVASGDDHDLYTTADNGASWTQRGSTVTNTLFNTATDLEVFYTSVITPGRLTSQGT